MWKGQLPRYFLEKGPGSRIRLCRPRDGCCSDSALLCALRVAVEDRNTCMAVQGSFLHRDGKAGLGLGAAVGRPALGAGGGRLCWPRGPCIRGLLTPAGPTLTPSVQSWAWGPGGPPSRTCKRGWGDTVRAASPCASGHHPILLLQEACEAGSIAIPPPDEDAEIRKRIRVARRRSQDLDLGHLTRKPASRPPWVSQ